MTIGKKPLTSSVFLILLSLTDADRHGLGIADEVERRSGGRVTLGTGTLYNALGKMLEQGLVEESDQRPPPEHDDPRRRYYRITTRGRDLARAEAERLSVIVGAAEDKSLIERRG